tara:strand:+ start:4288 stop:5373 length:1086 start_codon:yes stop_codon:yes gene_type:complete
MELGFFTMPLHPPGRNYRDTLREDREAILFAEELGFTEAFVGEHLTDSAETITSCLMFIASLVHDTETIKLGSGTVNLPNSHPAQVAAQVAMLDNLLEGRFLFGISPGGLPSDWEIFETLDKDRRAMFSEAIDMIIALWTKPAPYNLSGCFWNITTERTLWEEIGQGVMLTPFQKPHPPIVVTAVEPYSKSVMSAAERGWSPISANFLLPKWVETHWTMYTKGCEKAGVTADSANWRVAKSIFVSDDERVARDYGRGKDGPHHFYYNQLSRKLIRAGRSNLFKENSDCSDHSITTEGIVDAVVVCGTVNHVVDQLLEFREQVGDFGTLMYAGHDWVDPILARRSMDLMATEVLPRINSAIN